MTRKVRPTFALVLVDDGHQAHKYGLIPSHQHGIGRSSICKLFVELLCGLLKVVSRMRLIKLAEFSSCFGTQIRAQLLLQLGVVVVPNSHIGKIAEKLVANLLDTLPHKESSVFLIAVQVGRKLADSKRSSVGSWLLHTKCLR